MDVTVQQVDTADKDEEEKRVSVPENSTQQIAVHENLSLGENELK